MMNGCFTNKMRLCLVAALAFCLPAAAQVVQVQDGRALDANYGVAGGGSNTPRPSDAINSQLYITGQVTGLSRFRGRVGYSAADQLRLNLPSASLGGFTRQSVGLEQVIGGTTYRTLPYYDRARTALGVSRIAAGEAAPGTNMPRLSTIAPAAASRLYTDATADYGSIAVLKPENMISATPLVSPAAGSSIPPGGLPSDSAVPGKTDSYGTSEQPGIWVPGEQRSDAGAGGAVTWREDRIDLQRDTSVDARAENVARRDVTDKAERRKVEDTSRREFLPEPGQDVFVDVLVGLNELRVGQQASIGLWPAAAPSATSARTVDKGQRVGGLVEIVDKGIVVHTLAGENSNSLNACLAAAEEKLKAGRFYEAAAAYGAAIETSPANPLPHIGVALSLSAAGEPYSAAVSLRRAVELLPPVMEIKVDVPKMLGPQVDVWKERTLALDRRISRSAPADLMLRFLAVYAHYQLGEPDAAKAHAAELGREAKSDKVFSAYATFILTGQRPAQQKQADKGEKRE